MSTLIYKILNYEKEIFNEYISKRKKLIKNIKLQKNLNQSQTLNFINDIKAIIDPIKTSLDSIDYYFTNLNFDKSKSIDEISKMLFIYLFLEIRLGVTSSLDTLDTLESDSEPDILVSELKSESDE